MITPARPTPRRRRPGQFHAGLGIVCAMLLMAVLAPWLSPHGYADQDLLRSLQPPAWVKGGDWVYPLGTDRLGRDVLARLLYGARVSIAVAFLSVGLGGSLGTLLGLTAGYTGRWVDRIISRLIDVQLSFPPVFIAIAVMAALGQSLIKLIVVLRHVLPSILPPLLVVAAVNMSNVILAEAALSFLGLGIQPPTPAWGSMVSEGRSVQGLAWWNTVFPGMAIAVLVIGANLLSDGLQRER